MADINPPVKTLPVFTLPVAEINPPVNKLVPVTLPLELIPKLATHTLAAVLYNRVAYGAPTGPTSIPPLFAAVALAALLAMLMVKSFVLIVLELIVVVVP